LQEESTMAERQETSVMVSIQEILRDAQNREEQEKVEAERRAQAEEQRRVEEARKRQEEEAARLRSEEEDRQRRAFEEQRRQAELNAMQEAAVQRARAEAEAQARLAEMTARQEHERQLHALSQDKHKKRLTFILVGLGAVVFFGAIGGGIALKSAADKAQVAEAQLRALQDEKDKADQESSRLKAQLENTKDPEQIAALQAQLAAEQQKIQSLNTQMASKGSGGGGGGVRPAGGGGARPPSGGGAPSKPCNCTPGDPLCSCL
jgi:colicin import membrane protein